MRAEALSLARFLAEGALRGLFPLTLERIYRISAMVSWGVPLSGTLFPSIEGLGWIRANALEMARKHAEIRKGRSFSEEEFIKEVVSHERENFEVLLEVYSARYGDERFAGNRDAAQSIRKAKFREIDQILKYLQDVSFPLGEPGILRFIASPILGYTKAAITSKKKAWGIIRSAISAKHR